MLISKNLESLSCSVEEQTHCGARAHELRKTAVANVTDSGAGFFNRSPLRVWRLSVSHLRSPWSLIGKGSRATRNLKTVSFPTSDGRRLALNCDVTLHLALVYDLYCCSKIEILRSDHEYSLSSSRVATDVWFFREDNRPDFRNSREHGWPQSGAGPPSVGLCARISRYSHSSGW